MSVQAVPFWQSIRNMISGQTSVRDDSPRRIRITEHEARTLPSNVREIRVFSGGAWVSSLGEDVVLCEGQALSLGAKDTSVVVTSTGCKPVVLELLP